jgi:hypothetical protein
VLFSGLDQVAGAARPRKNGLRFGGEVGHVGTRRCFSATVSSGHSLVGEVVSGW